MKNPILLHTLITDANAGEEAKRLGLTHVGWGRYADKSGKVTHVSKQGKLVPIQKTATPTKVMGKKQSPQAQPPKQQPTKVMGKKQSPPSLTPVQQFNKIKGARKRADFYRQVEKLRIETGKELDRLTRKAPLSNKNVGEWSNKIVELARKLRRLEQYDREMNNAMTDNDWAAFDNLGRYKQTKKLGNKFWGA